MLNQTLERIANALERQNELTARQADMTFLQLTTNDQSRVELWEKRRQDVALKLRTPADALPQPVPATES